MIDVKKTIPGARSADLMLWLLCPFTIEVPGIAPILMQPYWQQAS
jgi:hypothetical protein